MSLPSKDSLQALYREILLTEGKAPATVYIFCKRAEIEESVFYDLYPNLEALEGDIFAAMIRRTEAVLESDNDAAGYDARQTLLAFYFTLLEEAKKERSFLLLRFPRCRKGGSTRAWKALRQSFLPFAEKWVQTATGEGLVSPILKPGNWLSEVMFPQIPALLYFFLEDDSQQFERSDAFVEKSVRLFLELIQSNILDSGLDLLRFLLGNARNAGETKPSEASTSACS